MPHGEGEVEDARGRKVKERAPCEAGKSKSRATGNSPSYPTTNGSSQLFAALGRL